MGGSESTPAREEPEEKDALPEGPPPSESVETSASAKPDADDSASSQVHHFDFLHDHDERSAREDFLRFWEHNVPGGARTRTVSRPLMRQVLLKATQQMDLSPRRVGHVGGLVADTLGASLMPVSQEDAFDMFTRLLTALENDGHKEAMLRGPSVQTLGVPSPTLTSTWEVGATPPKGVRTIDAAPFRESPSRARPLDPALVSQEAPGSDPRNLLAPLQMSRCALESHHVGLRAAFGAAQARYEALVLKAEKLRTTLVNGPDSGDRLNRQGPGRLAEVHRGLNMKRVKAISLETELNRCADRIRFSTGLYERQRRELAALQGECAERVEKAHATMRKVHDGREKLNLSQMEAGDLNRKAKTEQLRVVMLRKAFEQEQSRVGVSLERAETFVNDLVAANEDTRRVEAQEQAVARECASALLEIGAAQAHDELCAEARAHQLRRELAAAQDGAVSSGVSADYAKAGLERRAVVGELEEVRRRTLAVAAAARRRAAGIPRLQGDLEELQVRSSSVAQEIHAVSSKDGTVGHRRTLSGRLLHLQPRLRQEEAAEAALLDAESRLQGELEMALRDQGAGGSSPSRGGRLPAARQASVSASAAVRNGARLTVELELVRAELSAASIPFVPATTPEEDGRQWRAPGLDLEAAALQRRLGRAYASDRANQCRVQEVMLRQHWPWSPGVALHDSSNTKKAELEAEAERVSGALQCCSVALGRTEARLEELSRTKAESGRGQLLGPPLGDEDYAQLRHLKAGGQLDGRTGEAARLDRRAQAQRAA